MDPYTEYLGTGLARREPSYYLPQPSARPSRHLRADRSPRIARANRWLRRRA